MPQILILNWVADGAIGMSYGNFFKHKTDNAIEINWSFGNGYPLSYLSGTNLFKWIIEKYPLDQCIDDKYDVWKNDLLSLLKYLVWKEVNYPKK